MRDFKAGDRVKFTGTSRAAFTKGKTYTVREYPTRYGSVGVTEDNEGANTNGFHPDYWELVDAVPNEDFRNLSVGTRIVLKAGLREGNSEGYYLVTGSIVRLGDTPVTITRVLYEGQSHLHYEVDGKVRYITPEMIAKVIPEEVQEPKPLVKREVAFYYGEGVTLVCNLRNGLEVYETKQGELVVYNSKTDEVEGEFPL